MTALLPFDRADRAARARGWKKEGRVAAARQPVARATCFERSVRPPHQPIPHCYVAVRCFKPVATRANRDISRTFTEAIARARAKPRARRHVNRVPTTSASPASRCVTWFGDQPPTSFMGIRAFHSAPAADPRMRKAARARAFPLSATRCTHNYASPFLIATRLDIYTQD